MTQVKSHSPCPVSPHCPRCAQEPERAQRPRNVVRHGFCKRVQRVFQSALGKTVREVLRIPRYRCRTCEHVYREPAPDELRGRWYSSSTIALAIGAYAMGMSAQSARRKFGFAAPHHVDTFAWDALSRWVLGAASGELWPQQHADKQPQDHAARHATGRAAIRDLARRALDFLRGFAGGCVGVEPDIGLCGGRAATVPPR